MITLISAVIIAQIVTLAVVAAHFFVSQRRLYVLDAKRVADTFTAQLLHDYDGDLHLLDEGGVMSYSREKYGQLCAEFGLPTTATDDIASLVWGAIKTIRGDVEPATVGKGFNLYE